MRPRKVSGVATTELPEGEIVVRRSDGSEALILNALGAAVWELCDGSHTASQIVELLWVELMALKLPGVDSKPGFAQAVTGLLRRLREARLLEVDSEAGSEATCGASGSEL